MYVIKYIIVNDCFVICVGSSLLSKTVDVTLALSQHPLNPIRVTAQAGDRENWATTGTRHLANHPPEEKENKPA